MIKKNQTKKQLSFLVRLTPGTRSFKGVQVCMVLTMYMCSEYIEASNERSGESGGSVPYGNESARRFNISIERARSTLEL